MIRSFIIAMATTALSTITLGMEKSLSKSHETGQALVAELNRLQKNALTMSLSASPKLSSSRLVELQIKAAERNLQEANNQKNPVVAQTKQLEAAARMMSIENAASLDPYKKQQFSKAIEKLSSISNKENIPTSDASAAKKIVEGLADSLSSSSTLSASNITVVSTLIQTGLIGPIRKIPTDIKSPKSTHASRIRIVVQKDGELKVIKSYKSEGKYLAEKENFNSPQYKDIVEFINKKLPQMQIPKTMPYIGHTKVPVGEKFEYEGIYGAVKGRSIEDIEKSLESDSVNEKQITIFFLNIGLQIGALDFLFDEERLTQLIHADPNMGNFYYDEKENQLYWIDNDDMFEQPIAENNFKKQQMASTEVFNYYKEVYNNSSKMIDEISKKFSEVNEKNEHKTDAFKDLMEELHNKLSNLGIELEENETPVDLFEAALISIANKTHTFQLSENYSLIVKKLRDLAIKPRLNGHREEEGEAFYLSIPAIAKNIELTDKDKREQISEKVRFIEHRLLALQSVYQGYLDALEKINNARDIILEDYYNLRKEAVHISNKSGFKTLIQTIDIINETLKEVGINAIDLSKYNLAIEGRLVREPIQKQTTENSPLSESEEVVNIPSLKKRS